MIIETAPDKIITDFDEVLVLKSMKRFSVIILAVSYYLFIYLFALEIDVCFVNKIIIKYRLSVIVY